MSEESDDIQELRDEIKRLLSVALDTDAEQQRRDDRRLADSERREAELEAEMQRRDDMRLADSERREAELEAEMQRRDDMRLADSERREVELEAEMQRRDDRHLAESERRDELHIAELGRRDQFHIEEMALLAAAIESRDIIGQAKGVIMVTVGCSADEAFLLLKRQSQHENRKVTEVAAEIAARAQRKDTSGLSE
jgi:hypothetical protein